MRPRGVGSAGSRISSPTSGRISSWHRLCQTDTAPAPEPAKFSRAVLGGTLRYMAVSAGLGVGWLMAGGPPEFAGQKPDGRQMYSMRAWSV